MDFGGGYVMQMSSLLRATEPTGKDLMPKLFDAANTAKQAFLSGKRLFRMPEKLPDMTTGNLVYLIRSAALSVNYMNDPIIQSEFKRIARAVEDLWVEYFDLVHEVTGFEYDVRDAYQTWLQASGSQLSITVS
ncbi:hypothetical protein OH76DRAFT_183530 [Lentinus brumalis]|uniref:Uncharacterized protein n=1 Tax=Lentinus brumalis TaxID=2498619 RepID=A0A371CNA4_9APHY|nr:hypothetical protein OH76DRAFT_183530 [Polyporus brumalis]